MFQALYQHHWIKWCDLHPTGVISNNYYNKYNVSQHFSVVLSEYLLHPTLIQLRSPVSVLFVIRQPRRVGGGGWWCGGSGMGLMACRLLKPDHIHSLPSPWHQLQLPLPPPGLQCSRVNRGVVVWDLERQKMGRNDGWLGRKAVTHICKKTQLHAHTHSHK